MTIYYVYIYNILIFNIYYTYILKYFGQFTSSQSNFIKKKNKNCYITINIFNILSIKLYLYYMSFNEENIKIKNLYFTYKILKIECNACLNANID